jgi:hypothetical protein
MIEVKVEKMRNMYAVSKVIFGKTNWALFFVVFELLMMRGEEFLVEDDSTRNFSKMWLYRSQEIKVLKICKRKNSRREKEKKVWKMSLSQNNICKIENETIIMKLPYTFVNIRRSKLHWCNLSSKQKKIF